MNQRTASERAHPPEHAVFVGIVVGGVDPSGVHPVERARQWWEERQASQPRCACCGADPVTGAVEIPIFLIGGCNCYAKAPTVPVYRSRDEHLPDCPAYGWSLPVVRPRNGPKRRSTR